MNLFSENLVTALHNTDRLEQIARSDRSIVVESNSDSG